MAKGGRSEVGDRGQNKEATKLIRWAREQGWHVIYTGAMHLRFTKPGYAPITASGTPRSGSYKGTKSKMAHAKPIEESTQQNA
ncbi:hypothetical protein IB275_30370 [Pseudomonas sp. PDM21]|uniref:hypothetical protein n=1 Tax=Pseudomonas sp. PDM21 TaxID=2769257 RepID=UPI0017862014|nr:hypothetical protein [Pseudomonas sp. PDM21]MBD9674921.1 hypothetical protein [Pseudomonas sp. PDM21]